MSPGSFRSALNRPATTIPTTFPFPTGLPSSLIGVFVGTVFYDGGSRKLPLPNFGEIFPFPVLQFLGRHSLVIYVIHQPVLIGILLLTGTISL